MFESKEKEINWLTERLSAYNDDELPPNEDARFEKLLPYYPEVAKALDRIATLGHSVKDELNSQIPDNIDLFIHDSVMRRVRRKRLYSRTSAYNNSQLEGSKWKGFFSTIMPPAFAAAMTAVLMYFFVIPQPSDDSTESNAADEIIIVQQRGFAEAPPSPQIIQASSRSVATRRSPDSIQAAGQTASPQFQYMDIKKLTYFFVSPAFNPDGTPQTVVLLKKSIGAGPGIVLGKDNRVEIESIESQSGHVTVLGGGNKKITIILVEGGGGNMPPPPPIKRGNKPIDL